MTSIEHQLCKGSVLKTGKGRGSRWGDSVHVLAIESTRPNKLMDIFLFLCGKKNGCALISQYKVLECVIDWLIKLGRVS